MVQLILLCVEVGGVELWRGRPRILGLRVKLRGRLPLCVISWPEDCGGRQRDLTPGARRKGPLQNAFFNSLLTAGNSVLALGDEVRRSGAT